jgi:hypothetical protein
VSLKFRENKELVKQVKKSDRKQVILSGLG